MWICPRCQEENKESFAACESCGAPRSAGRFASSPNRMEQTGRMNRIAPAAQAAPVHSPRVMIAPGRRPLHMPDESFSVPANPAFPTPPRRPLMGFARLVGLMLLILLPLLTGLLAWRQYDALSRALLPLLLNADAAAWIKIAVYAGLCLIAFLISLLPGLWTLMKIPPRPRRPKKQEDEE